MECGGCEKGLQSVRVKMGYVRGERKGLGDREGAKNKSSNFRH